MSGFSKQVEFNSGHPALYGSNVVNSKRSGTSSWTGKSGTTNSLRWNDGSAIRFESGCASSQWQGQGRWVMFWRNIPGL